MTRLLAFARELQRASTFEELLLFTQAELAASLGYQHAWLFVADPQDPEVWHLLDIAGALRGAAWQVAPVLHVKGDAMLEEISRSDEPVVVVDARTDPRTDKKIVEQLGNRTIINVPLRLLDAPFGGFGTGTFGEEGCRPPTSEQLEYLVGMASQLAVAAGRIRFQQEQRSRADDGKFKGLLESAPDAIVIVDQTGRIQIVNVQAERLFGYDRGELIGEPIEMLVPERLRAKHGAERAGYHASPRTRAIGGGPALVARRKDGSEFPAEISLSPLVTAEGMLVSSAIRDVTERHRVEEALRRANAEAEAAIRELEAFSYSVAHDLRAPLRAIDGFSQAIVEDCADELGPVGHQHLARVRTAAQHMGLLIDGLLGLSRVARADLTRERVELTRLAQQIGARLRAASPERDVDLVVQEGLVTQGDPRLLTAALENLLGNAWKFTARADKARVEFGAVDAADGRTFFVRDNGVGFRQEYAHRLFGAFQRLHSASEFEGTGIGLATVQRIIRRHGGRIWAEGEVGQGATFYFVVS